ncbi:hypothetical protein RU639_009350 [Aspergillus parasiticus]
MPSRLPAPLFNFEWPLDSPELASPSSTRKRRSHSSSEAPQRSTEAIFNEIIHKIPTIRKFTELVFESIPPEQGSLICRTFLESGVFEASNASRRWTRRGLTSEAEDDLMDFGLGTTFDSFTGQYTHSSKAPDLFLRPATYSLPSIVVESGWSESWPRLRADKDLWMYRSTTVNVVILLKWSKCVRNRCKGKVEVWTRNRAGGLIMCEKPIFPEPAPAPDPGADVIQFTKLDLFGQRMVAGQDPNTVLALNLSDLRDFARERMQLMGLTPA